MSRLQTAFTVFVLGLALWACGQDAAARRSAPTLAELRATHERLHGRFQELVGRDAIATRAFADPGQIVVAMRAKWVEELMARVARQYLHRVTLDLTAVEAQATGKIEAGTFLGQMKVGDWRVEIKIQALRGLLSAGQPSLLFGERGLLKVALPARVRPSLGKVSIRFFWDSAGLANVLCRDFELTRDLEGRVLAQAHELAGAVQFSSEEGAIVAVPLFPDRRVPLRIDLSAASWAAVESALRSQDSLGRCGVLLKPEDVLEKLRALADRGIGVTLPETIFRTVRLPARVEKSVEVGDRTVGLAVAAGQLRSSSALLWSSASVRLEAAPAAASETPAH
ncbi:MAG TPA: hypothetical protein VI589_11810 [Vicinamibacteria bacterium]